MPQAKKSLAVKFVCSSCSTELRMARDGWAVGKQLLAAKARAVAQGDTARAVAIELIHIKPKCATCWLEEEDNK